MFRSGFNCCQAVVGTFGPELGLDQQVALKLGEGFGGGMAHLGEVCGAATGAIMVLGLKYGRTQADDATAKAKTAKQVRAFAAAFKARHGSWLCRDILKVNLDTETGRTAFKQGDLRETICGCCVRDAAEIVSSLL